MKQRLGIAEVLIKDPRVLFLDEPTLGLDPEGAVQLITLIRSLSKKREMTVLLCSHNLYQVQKMCNRVGIMIGEIWLLQGLFIPLPGKNSEWEKRNIPWKKSI